jgi:protein-tyrosine phosphatase
MAELLCRAMAAPDAALEVTSAGMFALVGEGIDGPSAAVLTQLGLDASRHRARQFEPAMAAQADLVLTAEAGQRDRIMAVVPTAFRRTFTMKEFARLARHATATATDRAEIVAQLARRRGAEGQLPSKRDNIADPYRSTVDQAWAAAKEIAVVVQTTLSTLGLAPSELAAPVVAAAVPRPRPRPRPRPG